MLRSLAVAAAQSCRVCSKALQPAVAGHGRATRASLFSAELRVSLASGAHTAEPFVWRTFYSTSRSRETGRSRSKAHSRPTGRSRPIGRIRRPAPRRPTLRKKRPTPPPDEQLKRLFKRYIRRTIKLPIGKKRLTPDIVAMRSENDYRRLNRNLTKLDLPAETFYAWLNAARCRSLATASGELAAAPIAPMVGVRWPHFVLRSALVHTVKHEELEEATELVASLVQAAPRATKDLEDLVWQLAWRILPPHSRTFAAPEAALPSTKAYHLLHGLTFLVLCLTAQRLGRQVELPRPPGWLRAKEAPSIDTSDVANGSTAPLSDIELLLAQYIDMLESHLLWVRDERIVDDLLVVRNFVHSIPAASHADQTVLRRIQEHIDSVRFPTPRTAENRAKALQARLAGYLHHALAGDSEPEEFSTPPVPSAIDPDDLPALFHLEPAPANSLGEGTHTIAMVQSSWRPTKQTREHARPRPLYTALMLSFNDRGQHSSTLAVWQALLASDYSPSARDLQEVCRALIETGQIKLATKVLNEWTLGKGGPTCVRRGNLKAQPSKNPLARRKVVDTTATYVRVQPDAHMFATLMRSLEAAGFADAAYSLFAFMRRKYRCPPDDFALDALMSVARFARAGDPDVGSSHPVEGPYEDETVRTERLALERAKRSFWTSSQIPAPVMARRLFRRILFAQHEDLRNLRSPLDDAMERGQLGWLMRGEMHAKRTEEWIEAQWKALTAWRGGLGSGGRDRKQRDHQGASMVGAAHGLDARSFRAAGAVNFVPVLFHSYVLLLDHLKSPRMSVYMRDWEQYGRMLRERSEKWANEPRVLRIRRFNSAVLAKLDQDPRTAEPPWDPHGLDEVRADEILIVLSWMRALGVRPFRTTLALICAYLDAIMPPAISFGESPAGPLHEWLVDWLGEEAIPTEEEVVGTYKQRFGEED